MHTYLKRLSDERLSLTERATNLTESAASAQRDLTDAERADMATMQERCADIDRQLVDFSAQADSARAFASLQDRLNLDPVPGRVPNPMSPSGSERAPAVQTRSWSDALLNSDEFRSYDGTGRMRPIEVHGVFETRAPADPITTAFLPQHPTQIAAPTPAVRRPMLGVISRETVSTSAVEYISWNPADGPAAPIVAEGALKPPADFTVASVVKSLETFAHWKAITRQALEDIPRLQSIVEGKLQSGITLALENAACAALTGATGLGSASGATLLEAVRNAIATAQTKGYQPNALAANPADLAAMDIALLNAASMNGATIGGSYWGLTPVPNSTIPAGTAYVGDFATAITLFDRGVGSVYVTDSHADLFLKNTLVILAEERALVALVEPAAVVKAAAA